MSEYTKKLENCKNVCWDNGNIFFLKTKHNGVVEETNKWHVFLATRSDTSLPIAEQFARFLFRKRHSLKKSFIQA